MSHRIRSKPTYTPLEYDPRGMHNLLVGLGEGVGAIEEMISRAGDAFTHQITDVMITGTAPQLDEARALFSESDYASVSFYEDKNELIERLPNYLTKMNMGFRLYCAGPEQFIWDVASMATKGHVHEQQMQVEGRGSQARRVTCTHCGAFTSDVTTNIVPCAGCGLHLFVYDHFSRRLRAYMGFRVDAEAPGELPEIEEVFK